MFSKKTLVSFKMKWWQALSKKKEFNFQIQIFIYFTLESGIDVGQGITVGPGKFDKKNKDRVLNKHRAWKVWRK